MRSRLPTAALTPSRLPAPDGPAQALIRFAQSLDGYEAIGAEGASDLGRWAERHRDTPLEGLSLHDLRVVLFARQRAHYHQGGGWPGEPDSVLEEMRTLTGAIRGRVARRGSGVAVWRGDLTTLDVDAIVNAANPALLGGGGVDGAIHRAASPALLDACRALPEVAPGVRCPTGEARITPGFGLPARHVIHTVGPLWHGGDRDEASVLAAAYTASLDLAAQDGLESVAFPALSTGVYGYPAGEAATVAARTVRAFLDRHEGLMRVLLVAYDAQAERVLRGALRASG